MPFAWRRRQTFALQRNIFCPNANLTLLSAANGTFRAHNVSVIQRLGDFKRLRIRRGLTHGNLQIASVVAQPEENNFSKIAVLHHAASDFHARAGIHNLKRGIGFCLCAVKFMLRLSFCIERGARDAKRHQTKHSSTKWVHSHLVSVAIQFGATGCFKHRWMNFLNAARVALIRWSLFLCHRKNGTADIKDRSAWRIGERSLRSSPFP